MVLNYHSFCYTFEQELTSHMKHWEYTAYVSRQEFDSFSKRHSVISTRESIPSNTGVFVQCETGSKRLEGVYDSKLGGIRPLLTNGPNRDMRLYLDAIQNENITIIAVDGLMGTGKTSTIIEAVIKQYMLKDHEPWKEKDEEDEKPFNTSDHKVLIAKPHVNAGGSHEQYGHLPGDLYEKLDPTLGNFIQYFDRWHPEGFHRLREKGQVQVLPLGFIRGLDAENMTIIVDEAQNTRELVTVVTRKAKMSRIVLLGDTSPFQIDLEGNTPKKNGLKDIIDLLAGAPYFQYIKMQSIEHILRSEETRDIVKRLFKKYGENPIEWII